MTATDESKPRKRRRKPVHPLPRQQEQKPVAKPQQAGREWVLRQLEDAIGACDSLFEQHCDACTCETCCVVSNMVGSLRVFHMLLEIS